MGSSRGGGGNPAAFTGGGLSAPPGPSPSSTAPEPYYPSFLPSGGGMATPQSVAQAIAAQPPPAPVAAAPAAAAGPMQQGLGLTPKHLRGMSIAAQMGIPLGMMFAKGSNWQERMSPRDALAISMAYRGGGGGTGLFGRPTMPSRGWGGGSS